ncbi:hypothetical protein MKX03_022070, partial [Papaver bracteatum]
MNSASVTLSVLLIISFFHASISEVYKVGGDLGCTMDMPNLKYYRQWAQKHFYVGDFI